MDLKKTKEKIKNQNPMKIIPVVLILILLSIPLAANEMLIESEEFSFQANATATNTTLDEDTQLGVVTDPTLQFGEVPAGAEITKKISISSSQPALSHIDSTGNISDQLKYSETRYFEGNTEIETKFNATEPGYYEGAVEMNVQTPKRTGGSTWLEIKSKLPY